MFNIEKKDWEKTTIEEIATIKGGKRMPKGRILLETETPHPYIKVKNMHGSKIINLDKDFEFVSENDFEKISNYTVKSGDIIISIVGTIGLVSLVGETLNNANLTENCVKLINIDNFSTEYLYYYLTSEIGQYEIAKGIVGSTQPKLPIYNIKKISIPRPPLKDQKLIANILSSFDDKIENNNAIIANLEEQAQAIFKSWFVDFEPFQEEAFVSSELGNIPSFWQVVEANDWFKINIGKTPPRKQSEWFSTDPNDIKWLSISDMKNIQTFANKTSEYLTNEAIDKFNVRMAPANSVLLSFKLTVGRVAITRDELTTNEAIAHFHINKYSELYYLYLYLKTFNYQKLGNTSSIGNAVNSKIIKAMPILKPDDKTLMKFHIVIEPLFNMIYEKVKENEKLTTIRDILLPKLMSGEIRVEEAWKLNRH